MTLLHWLTIESWPPAKSMGCECSRKPVSLGLESRILKPNFASTHVTISRRASSKLRKRLELRISVSQAPPAPTLPGQPAWSRRWSYPSDYSRSATQRTPNVNFRLEFQKRASSQRNDRAKKASLPSSCRRITSFLQPSACLQRVLSTSWQQCHESHKRCKRLLQTQTPGFVLLAPGSSQSPWFLNWWSLSWIPSSFQQPTATPSQTPWPTPAKNAAVFFDHCLITASLSSNTYNKASWREEVTFEEIKMNIVLDHHCFHGFFSRWRFVRVSPCLINSDSCFQELQRSYPKGGYTIQPQSFIQRNDVWFFWTVRNLSLFLTHPTYWHKCMTSKNAQCSSTNGFWILKISRKNQSWNSPTLHCLAVLPKRQYCLYSQLWWTYEINRFRRLTQALVHFVMDRASLFTWPWEYQVVQFLPNISISGQFESMYLTILQQISFSSSLKWWSSMHGVDTL